MPASISLSKISWSTPDSRTLFADLDLQFGPGLTGLTGRNGTGKTTLLRLISGELLPAAGSLTVDGRLGVLRQIVGVDPEETVAGLFGAVDGLCLAQKALAGMASLDELAAVDWNLEGRIEAALSRLGLDARPGTRLATLSGGQRTRAALAALIFSQPDFILLDEPTNNLDREGREAVFDLLSGWRGGAVIVSHDRELLERMDTIVELTTLGATVYGGNWSHYRERKAIELAAARHDLAAAEQRIKVVQDQAQVVRERKQKKEAAGKRTRAKGGMPRILLGKFQETSEQTAGGNARLAARRGDEAVEDAGAARKRIETLQPLTVSLPPTGLPAGKVVLDVRGLTGGYDEGPPVIRDFGLTVAGPERVAISGPNGSGKTTLLALLTGTLRPWSGSVSTPAGFAMLDQRVSLLDRSETIRDNFLRLNSGAGENACRAALARFLFRADAALQLVSSLSGGQMLRAGLACVLGGQEPPVLLILDEPTNHLDIESIETIEAGLRAYDGALLVVSHDTAFLEAIGIGRRIGLTGGAAPEET